MYRVGFALVGVHPPGNHVQIGIEAVQRGKALAFIVAVAYLDFSQVIPQQSGHAANRRALPGEQIILGIIQADLQNAIASHAFSFRGSRGRRPLQGHVSDAPRRDKG